MCLCESVHVRANASAALGGAFSCSDDTVSSVAQTVKSADKPAADEAAVLAALEKDGKAVLEVQLYLLMRWKKGRTASLVS